MKTKWRLNQIVHLNKDFVEVTGRVREVACRTPGKKLEFPEIDFQQIVKKVGGCESWELNESAYEQKIF